MKRLGISVAVAIGLIAAIALSQPQQGVAKPTTTTGATTTTVPTGWSGFERVTRLYNLTTGSPQAGIVSGYGVDCPPGKTPIGGGYHTYNTEPDLNFQVYSNGPGTQSWIFRMRAPTNYDSTWEVYALCAVVN